ncbi:hypothetical protein MPSI1_002971 [Malassezia psittaci]|uniref:RRM domain-containing protein n=1 Tax=Malassezia psittaci TaxID=1821823 RepID=A0AAF0FCK6_9BASI|nr:hypothetical protein MPSI1_002971 [Malassezia psittaci]
MDVEMSERRTRAPRRRSSGTQRSGPYDRERPGVSIKGASGPTWIVVANLVKGTSLEDVRLTFDSMGKIAEVRGYRLPNLASNAVAFQVAFEHRGDAIAACRKFDGVMADGRVLQVTMQGSEPAPKVITPPPAKVVQAAPQPKVVSALPADLPATAHSTDASLPIAVRRRLAEAEARYLKETEKILTNKGAPEPKPTKSNSLKDRISSLPLAQRLQMEGAASKKKKPQRKRAGGNGGMEVDS